MPPWSRALLVPALIALLDRWNWWLPRRARQLLRVPCPVGIPADGPASRQDKQAEHDTLR